MAKEKIMEGDDGMTTKKGTKTRKKKDAEPFEGLRARVGRGSDKWYGGARERVIALKGEALAPIADEYREMVKSVLLIAECGINVMV